jgi:hypothetical protein
MVPEVQCPFLNQYDGLVPTWKSCILALRIDIPQLQSFQSLELHFHPSFGPSLAVPAKGVRVFFSIVKLWMVLSNRFGTRLRHLPARLNQSCASSEGHWVKKTAAAGTLRTVLSLSMISFSFLVSPPAHAQTPAPLEYRSKAYFLAQFPRFIDWPDTAFPSSQAPFLICILGDFSLGPSLAEFMRGTLAHGRRVEIRSVHPDQDLRACQILFVTQSKRKIYGKVLELVQGSNVLTIGETPDFIDAGGGVSLLFEHEALHFEVNLAAANRAHLRISSGMLALARRVVNKPEDARS